MRILPTDSNVSILLPSSYEIEKNEWEDGKKYDISKRENCMGGMALQRQNSPIRVTSQSLNLYVLALGCHTGVVRAGHCIPQTRGVQAWFDCS